MRAWLFGPWRLNMMQCSGVNIYLISKLWLFGMHFYYKPQCLILKKIFTRKFKMSRFLHNVQQNVHNSSKFRITFWVWCYFQSALFLPLNLLYPQNLMFLILSNGIYWVNNILHIFSIFLQPYLLLKRQKNWKSSIFDAKIHNFSK